MSYEPVDVYVRDQLDTPIQGVIIKVFSPTGETVFTQQVTDVDGKASFLLFTQSYSMRFYKFHAAFLQPQQFAVLEAPETNAFNVVGEIFVPPMSTDARLCRAWGYFRDPDGSPQEHLDLHFYPEFSPILLEGSGVVPRKVAIRSDANGYAQIDLIRGGCYRVTIEGMEHEERFVRVPDLGSCNLPDMLFAVVSRVTFDPEGPYSISVGDELEVTPTVYDSAGATLTGTGQNDVNWSSSNLDVLSISVGQTKLTLRGVAAGSAELRAERQDLSIIRIPSVAISGQPISITVP